MYKIAVIPGVGTGPEVSQPCSTRTKFRTRDG